MADNEDNQVLFEKSLKRIELDARILRDNSQGFKTGKGHAYLTRRPVSLDPRIIDNTDNGPLEDVIKMQSHRLNGSKLDISSRRELEEVIRNYHNRSLSPQLIAENIEKRDKLARASKRLAEDVVRRTQNRSLSPKLLQRLDSKSKVTIEELTEHNRYIKEKHDSNMNLPLISSSPMTQYVKSGFSSPAYNKDKVFTPAQLQASRSKRLTSTSDYDSGTDLGGSPSPGADTGGETDDDISENILVSRFPFVEDDEISRHKLLNQEAEKTSKKKTMLNKQYLDYLQRLKLTRKAIAQKEKEARDARNARKKLLAKTQLKNKLIQEQKEETPPPPEIPEKNVEECVKLGKVIQSFRYSYAIDDYYNGRIRRSFDSVANSDITEDGLKNGWLIKNLGSQVLNLNMRFLPSCNPFELRKRRRMLRARAEEETRLLRRMSTNESLKSRSSRVHFQEPVGSRLHSIYERHGSIQSDLKSESGKSGKSEQNMATRLSISERRPSLRAAERKDSRASDTGMLTTRRKSSRKVVPDTRESGGRNKIFLNMTALSSET